MDVVALHRDAVAGADGIVEEDVAGIRAVIALRVVAATDRENLLLAEVRARVELDLLDVEHVVLEASGEPERVLHADIAEAAIPPRPVLNLILPHLTLHLPPLTAST